MTLGERLYSPSLILIHRNVLNMREGLSILYLAKSHLSIKSATYCFSALIYTIWLGVSLAKLTITDAVAPVNSINFI